jgi:hypothetical protein
MGIFCLVLLEKNYRIDLGPCMDVFLNLLLDFVIELKSDVDLGFLLLPEVRSVLPDWSLQLGLVLCHKRWSLESSPSVKALVDIS